METPYQSQGPGGMFQGLIGNPLNSISGTILPTHMMHHVTGAGTISIITPPWPDFMGPLILISDGGFDWDDGGNIEIPSNGSTIELAAYTFIYDRQLSKWYPFSFAVA